ncbi:DUF6714 family protein [Streptomyces niveus]|uniref:DUF6714 family protein n=1 Tax=Streptomyces niveus TaxID=193462 RepID=UPI00342E49BD
MNEDELDELSERLLRMEIWAEIDLAFNARIRPDAPLTFGDKPVADDVESTLREKDWQEVTPSDLRRIRIDIGALRPDAFWYYSRAFMRSALLSDDDLSDDPGGWVVSALTPLEAGISDRFRRRIEDLSPVERLAVARFVHWYDGETFLAARDRLLALWLI